MGVASVPFAPLLAALAEVRDSHRAQGWRYGIRHLLLFSVLAVLAGATSYQGVITFIALQLRDQAILTRFPSWLLLGSGVVGLGPGSRAEEVWCSSEGGSS